MRAHLNEISACVCYAHANNSFYAEASISCPRVRCFYARGLQYSYAYICLYKQKRAFSCSIGVKITRKHLFIRRIHVIFVIKD